MQTEQVLLNLANLLQAAGSNTANIVRRVAYLKNMADFVAMNQAYALFFGRDALAQRQSQSVLCRRMR